MNWFNHRKKMCGLKVKITELKRGKARDKVLIAELDKEIERQDEIIVTLEQYIEGLGGPF